MNYEDRNRIKELLGKEKLELWDVSRIMEFAAKLVQETPGSILSVASDGLDSSVKALVARAEHALVVIANAEQQLADADERLYKLVEEAYKKAATAKKQLEERLEKLEKIPDIRLPYNTRELIEIAEKCSHLSDEQWSRVVDLAKAFRQQEVANS